MKMISKDKIENYQNLMDFINYVFGFNGSTTSFPLYLPRLHKEKYEPTAKTTVIKDDNKYLACATFLSYNVHVLNGKYRLGTIGNVAVHPNERNKGYMKEIMDSVILEALNDNVDAISLTGMRERYKNYFFDNAGISYNYHLEKNEIKKYLTKNNIKLNKIKVLKVKENDLEEIEKSYLLVKTLTHRASRKRNEYFDIMNGMNGRLYHFYFNKTFIGYAVYHENESLISEINVTNPKYLSSTIISLLDYVDKENVDLTLPPFKINHIDILNKIADYYYISNSAKFLIVNFEKLINLYLNLKASYMTLDNTDFIVKINGFKYQENLHVCVKDNNVLVEHTTNKENFTLSYFEAVEFFFSSISVLRLTNKYVKNLFPLPLYISKIDNI